MPIDELSQRTVRDFGAQWTQWQENEGYYGSARLLQDLIEPALTIESLKDATVLEIGSGSGRVVNMLLDVGVREVIAVEPSLAFDVLKKNTFRRSARIRYLNVAGDQIRVNDPVDIVVSIGVIHHIPDPDPVLKRAYAVLKPGGRCFVWLYGREGNETYLRFAQPLRRLTSRMPDWLLTGVAWVLNCLLSTYITACRFIPLPMRSYMRNVLAKFSWRTRLLTIFDQLNPAYAKYYRQSEVLDLLARAGFKDVHAYPRHGYSWQAVGSKR